MRLFTALDLPEEVRTQFAELQMPGALNARWTRPAQFHITVRFIGDADPEQALRYENALEQVEVPAAECVPYGLDVLPSRRNPRVLIVGLKRSNSLLAVFEAVSNALEAEGLDTADRTYRPHVTLARLNDVSAETVHDFLETHAPPPLPTFRVSALHLYESTLTQDGAVHERRASVPLGR